MLGLMKSQPRWVASAVGRRKERDEEKDYKKIRDLIQEVVRIRSS